MDPTNVSASQLQKHSRDMLFTSGQSIHNLKSENRADSRSYQTHGSSLQILRGSAEAG